MSLDKVSAISTARMEEVTASPLQRYLTLLAIKLVKRFQTNHGKVLFLTKNICVKRGGHVNLNEALTLRFVAKHTSVPVPRVYWAFSIKCATYIVMERIHGHMVGKGWMWRSEESKRKILEQPKAMIEETRRIQPPVGASVSHIDGGPFYDVRLLGPSNHHGPFKTIQDFHRYLRDSQDAHPDHFPEIGELIAQQDALQSDLVFTHGDLSSLNILASGDKVVGIVDWEIAGWYPSYWELSTAWNVNPQNQFWQDEVEKVLEPMPTEMKMEKLRRKYFGMFGYEGE